MTSCRCIVLLSILYLALTLGWVEGMLIRRILGTNRRTNNLSVSTSHILKGYDGIKSTNEYNTKTKGCDNALKKSNHVVLPGNDEFRPTEHLSEIISLINRTDDDDDYALSLRTISTDKGQAAPVACAVPDDYIKLLMNAANDARRGTQGRLSRKVIGFALMGKSGKIYKACNVADENFGTCAVSSAYLLGRISGESDFVACAYVGEHSPCVSCDNCYKLMNENPSMPVIISSPPKYGNKSEIKDARRLLANQLLEFHKLAGTKG